MSRRFGGALGDAPSDEGLNDSIYGRANPLAGSGGDKSTKAVANAPIPKAGASIFDTIESSAAL